MVSRHFGLPLQLRWSHRDACPGHVSDWIETDDWTIVEADDPPGSFTLHGAGRLAGASPTYVAHMHILRDVMTRAEFNDQAKEVVRGWRLQPHLQERVDTLSETLDLPNRNGLHIRRSDKTEHAKKLGWDFYDPEVLGLIEGVKAGGGAKFFLATCSPETRAVYVAAFPDWVATADYEFGGPNDLRHTSMDDAVVDLWALGRCGQLFGSQGSCFTDFAEALMGHKAFRFGKEDQNAKSWCEVDYPQQ
jgi:hypothetical protein